MSAKSVFDTCELLAPAGNFDMLRASIDAGADAAYLGLGDFNARRNAQNFDFDSFAKACRYAHLRGARIYVTMNTIIFDDELERAIDSACRAYDLGADAFIIQDLGLAMGIRGRIPDARLHASTQMSIHSIDGLKEAKDLGFARATLAREMSLGEIGAICSVGREIGIEVETFAHGAICISYSGQCLMSSMIGCRSANRGLCAQPCRLEYELVDLRDSDKKIASEGPHLLSPKDLCTIDDVCDLVDAGVASLKIEGRMKSPEYAHTVVSVYRKRLDEACPTADLGEDGTAPGQGFSVLDDSSPNDQDARDREKLGSVFSRGFTSAYLDGIRGASMMSFQRPNNRGQFIGRVKRSNDQFAEISLERPLKAGDRCEIWTRRGNLIVDVDSDHDASRPLRIDIKDLSNRRPSGGKGDSGASRDAVYPSKGDRVFRIRSADAQLDISDQDPVIPVNASVVARIGKPLSMEFSLARDGSTVSNRLFSRLGPDGVSSYAEGHIVESARTKAITADEIIEHVSRTGGTPFRIEDIQVELDDGVGMGFSQIHKLRKLVLENLEENILLAEDARYVNECPQGVGSEKAESASRIKKDSQPAKHALEPSPRSGKNAKICVLVSNPECARAAKRNGADIIYVSALNYRRGASQMQGVSQLEPSQAGYPKHCVLDVGAISHDAIGRSRESLLDASAWDAVKEGSTVVVGSIDAIRHAQDLGCEIELGPELPIVNHLSTDVASALDAKRVWLTSELSLSQIERLLHTMSAESPQFGLMVSGAQELMTSEHCILQGLGKCDEDCPTCPRRKVPFALRDRLGYEFPIMADNLGRTHIFNSVETDNMGAIPRLLDAGVEAFMVNAQLMDAERTAQETARLRQALELATSGVEIDKRKGTTTAHMYRPIS